MLNKVFSKKRKRRINLFLFILPFLALMIVFGVFGYKSIVNVVSDEKVSDEFYIESMYYKLRSNATEYQKELFEELRFAIEDGTDEPKIAALITENFVADYYTWTNKQGSYDVGGAYYVFSENHANFVQKSRDRFYKYLSYYIETYGSEALLEVNNIEVLASYENDELYESSDGELFKSFTVVLEWTYNDYTFDTETEYQTSGYYNVIIKDNGRFEIAELNY